jgi:cysteine desulfurase
VTVRDLGVEKGGIVTFTVDGKSTQEINAALAEKKINTTSSSIFSTRYDMENREQTQFVRASAHYLTTEAECALLAEAVGEISLTRS